MGFESCGPNEAMIITGCCHSTPLLIAGGRTFIWPGQKAQRIGLDVMELNVSSFKVRTMQDVPISVTGVAQVKINGQSEEMLRAAFDHFLGKSTYEINEIASVAFERHQSATIGTTTAEEICQDKKKFSKSVLQAVASDFQSMGISILSYTLKDIRDEKDNLFTFGTE